MSNVAPSVFVSVEAMVKAAVAQALPSGPGGATAEEAEALSKLFMMRVSPSGKEDPRALLRSMSSSAVDAVASRFERLGADPIAGPILQFFLIEWGFRHDYLHEDWHWHWDTDREGHVRYSSKVPIDELIQKLACSS